MQTHTESPFASTLPGRYYYDPTLYALEQERIFARIWMCAGRSESLAEPGSYKVVTIAQESVLIVHDKHGALHAFLNVCRHRGSRLCMESSGHLKGSIQCRYHAWTYALDGRLLGAPNVMNNEQFDRATFSLVPVALTQWEGFIWLNLASDPPPALEQIEAPIIERFGSYAPFARYALGNLRIGKTITYEVEANWKLLLENFMECYHCGPLHPEFCELLPGFRAGQIYIEDEAAQLADGVEAFSITGNASRPPLPGLLPEDLRRYYGIVIVPNVLLNLLDDHIVTHTLYPQGPTRTRIVCEWLFDQTTMQDPNFDPMDAVQLFDIVNKQDWQICEATQLGMASRAYHDGGAYVPMEHHIRALCDFVLAALEC